MKSSHSHLQRPSNRTPKGTPPKRSDSNSTPESDHKTPKRVAAKCLNTLISASPDELPIAYDSPDLLETSNSDQLSPESVITDVFQDSGEIEAQNAVNMNDLDVNAAVAAIVSAHLETLNSSDLTVRAKKVLDAVIKVAIEDLAYFPVETEDLHETFTVNKVIAIICVVLSCIAFVWLAFLSKSGADGSFSGVPPT